MQSCIRPQRLPSFLSGGQVCPNYRNTLSLSRETAHKIVFHCALEASPSPSVFFFSPLPKRTKCDNDNTPRTHNTRSECELMVQGRGLLLEEKELLGETTFEASLPRITPLLPSTSWQRFDSTRLFPRVSRHETEIRRETQIATSCRGKNPNRI